MFYPFRKCALTATVVFCAVAGSARAQDNSECLGCHDDKSISGKNAAGKDYSVYVTSAALKGSAHESHACVDCHADLAGTKDFPHGDNLKAVDCGRCHEDEGSAWTQSAHGKANPQHPAATCTTCHGTHRILKSGDPKASTAPNNLPHVCASCHSEIAKTRSSEFHTINPYDRYMKGVHAQGIARGLESSAACNDCHGMHDIKMASDPAAPTFKINVPKTCAKCHNNIFIMYSRGIHGKALAAGVRDAPNCTDCHGEHGILPSDDPASPTNPANISDFVCAKCHNNPVLMEKYGVGAGRFTSYQDSYHGLARKGGSVKAANCVSCHRAHDILPKNNPASSINPENLIVTCQKCHPKANAQFSASYSHGGMLESAGKIDTLVRNFYILMIIAVIGGMLLHNAIIYLHHVREKHRRERGLPRVERFNRNMVWQHWMLLVSFITLVFTGFALKYPQAFWVQPFTFLGMDEAVRSTIHRLAALLLLYASLHHVVLLLWTKRGRKELRAMLPNLSDLTQALQNIRYHLGLRHEHAKFGQYDYTEKAEYWALIWGTFVMALTGLLLWFPTKFTEYFPAWVVKVAETVHFYEAWLATLSILVFHFFFVILLPGRYPMSLTWITGKMTEEERDEHHPGWKNDGGK